MLSHHGPLHGTFGKTPVAPGTVGAFLKPKMGELFVVKPLNRIPSERTHGMAGYLGYNRDPIRRMTGNLEQAVLLPDARDGQSFSLARQDLLASWGVPASTTGLPDSKGLLDQVLCECADNVNTAQNLGNGLDAEITHLMAHILQNSCSEPQIDALCQRILGNLAARSAHNAAGGLSAPRLGMTMRMQRLINVIATRSLMTHSRMEDMSQAQRMLTATFFRHVAHEVENRGGTAPEIRVRECFSPEIRRLVVAHLALVAGEFGQQALTLKEQHYLKDMALHGAGWESAANKASGGDDMILDEVAKLVRQQVAHCSMETHQSTPRPVAVGEAFPALPVVLSGNPDIQSSFIHLTGPVALSPFMALLHMSKEPIFSASDSAALKREATLYLSRSSNPQGLINDSVGRLYRNRMSDATHQYHAIYDALEPMLSQLKSETVSVSLAPGDPRRESGHRIAAQFADDVLPAFFSMSAGLEAGGVSGAAGRKLHDLEQTYRDELAQKMGCSPQDMDVTTTVNAHFAPLRAQVMRMCGHEDKIQVNRQEMAAVLVHGGVADIMPALSATTPGASRLVVAQRSALEHRFIRQLHLVIGRIELALDKAKQLPKSNPHRQSILALRRKELMAIQSILTTLESPDSNPRERKTILDNLIEDPSIFSEWLGAVDGENSLTQYLDVVDRPFTMSGNRAQMRHQVAPNDAALRHTHRRFVTPGYGHTTGATMVRVANVRQKLMQAITNEDRKYTDLNTDDVAFIVGLIEDELSGYALIDPQVRQLLVHPVVRFYLQEHLQTSVEHRDLLTGWYASETYSNDYVSHIPADNASFGTDAIVLNIVAKNDGSPGVPISLSEYVLGWPATKLPAQTFTPLAQRIPRLTSNERRVLQMVLARWALDGDAATSEQKAMLQLYRGRYLDEAILDTMTNGQTLHPVTQKYVDGLVTRVASGQFSVRESEAKLALQLISHSDASQVSSRLFDWQAHYEMCCGIESKFHANTVSSLDDLSPTEKAVINRLYLRVVSKATPDPAFGEVEEAIMLHAMSVGLLPENTLYVANAMCGRIMAKLQESVEGVPALNAAEHAFIQRMPELMKTHKWPIGNAADMVVVLFADPAYFTFNPPLKPEDRNEVTARFLDVRVRQVQAMVTQRAHLGIRDRALGRMFGESMYTRIYGMDEAALFALKEAVIPGSSGQSILNLAVERRGDGRLEMVLSPGDNIDAAEGNGTLENLFASMFKSGDDAGISVEDGLARVRVRVLEVDADPSVDNRLRLNGLDDLGAATRRRSAATGLQLVLEQYSGQLAPMNSGLGAVVAEMESVGRGGTQERLRDAVQHGELTMSYVTQSPENGFKEEHILVTLPLSQLAALNSDENLKAALNQLIGVAGGKVRFAIQDDAGHVFYVDTRNAGTTNPPRAVYNALDIATKINAFKALDFPHRLETVVEEGTRYLRIALVPETPETWDKWHSAIYEGDRAKYHGKMDCLKELLASGVQVKLGATASGDIVFGAPTAANLTGEFGGVLNFIRSHHKTQVFKLIYDAVDVASVDLQGYFKGKMDSLRVFATQLNAALDTHLITVANTIHGNGQVVAITLSKFTYTEEEKAQLHALLAAAKAVWGQQGNSAITLPVLFRQQDGQRIGANLTDAAAVTGFISA